MSILSYLKHYCSGNNSKSGEHYIIYRRNNCGIECIQSLKYLNSKISSRFVKSKRELYNRWMIREVDISENPKKRISWENITEILFASQYKKNVWIKDVERKPPKTKYNYIQRTGLFTILCFILLCITFNGSWFKICIKFKIQFFFQFIHISMWEFMQGLVLLSTWLGVCSCAWRTCHLQTITL